MRRFLLAYFSIYSLMHAFVYSRVKNLLPDLLAVRAGVMVFLALMVLAPVGARLLDRLRWRRAARGCGLAGYIWLGFLFYCFCGFVLVSMAGVLLRPAADLFAGFVPSGLAGPAATVCVLASAAAINIYGYFEARSVRVERLVVESSKLPPGVDSLRIAQISDVHLGPWAGEKRMARILCPIEAERPDMLVSTGDLIDGSMEKIEAVAVLFSKIPTRLGKYAVTGNHEVYAGLAESIAAKKALGFTVLRGEAKRIENIVTIAGVDDPAAGPEKDEKAVLDGVKNGLFTLLLKHRPSPCEASPGLFDLQLSGHTHYGQLFPFRYITGLFYPLQNGLYHLANGSLLYTSRGSGTWGPPVRVLARPEVTIIDVVRENGVSADVTSASG